MDLYFLDHLCSFWTFGRINNLITEESIYFEKDQRSPLIKVTRNSNSGSRL